MSIFMSRATRALVVCGMGGVLFAAGSKASAATNLLVDPGFEVSQGNVDATAGDVNSATGWTVFGNGYTTASQARAGGTQSLKTFFQYNGAYQQIAVVTGDSYTASVYADDASADPMSTGTVASVELNFYTDAAGDNPIYNVVPILTGGTSAEDVFTLGTVTATVPAGYDFARIQLNQTSNGAGGATFYDDASVVDNSTATTPEPASLSLIGLGGAALLRRRRQA